MEIEIEEEEEKILISFQSNEFLIGVAELLKLNLDIIPNKREDAKEIKQLEKLCSILDEYQEQSYLLDPYLEQLVQPLIAIYRSHIRKTDASFTNPRVGRLSRLIYFFTKVRGAKTIVRLFPHEVDDLGILLSIFENTSTLQAASWELRYILLLWLSLVALLPFSFASIDHREHDSSSGKMLGKIERIGLRYLGVPGKEREGAIAVLARYYSRQDSSISEFVQSCQEALNEPSTSIFLSSGILQTLSEIVKIGSPIKVLAANVEFALFLKACDSISKSKNIGGTKARIKLSGRLAILRLTASGDMDEVEGVVQELFEALGSPDTIVRWSASKYLARIAERLPEASSHQIVEALLDIFVTEDAALDNVRASENAWQGACLALAELARRGRIPDDLIGDLLISVLRALSFDRKRGVQSVGVGVRDAAAYVLWSLARTITPAQALPYANTLAMHLVCASLFDREIQIRRAASAAFQESVGRWGVFPHGIDVLRTVDFLTVSVRKRAFLEAAPEVALHPEYRQALVDHLIKISLAHYDPEIRILASASLEKIVILDPEVLISKLVSTQISSLNSKDNGILHGALLSLSSLATACRSLPDSPKNSIQSEILRSLSNIAITTLSSRAYLLLLPAALQVIENSCTPEVIEETKNWWTIITLACTKSDEETHRQAAAAMRGVSAKADSFESLTLIASLSLRALASQQSSALILGCLDYSGLNASRLSNVVDRLIQFCGQNGVNLAGSIEGKRNGIFSLTSIICDLDLQKSLSSTQVRSLFDTLLAGFNDYTVDQRGDVGSWVRLASIDALKRLFTSQSFLEVSNQLQMDQIESAWACLLKQSLERLDKVREAAGNALQESLDSLRFLLSKNESESTERLYSLVPRIDEQAEWKDIQWTSERVLPFLAFESYRRIVLEGAVLGITLHSSSSPFFDYAISLPTISSTLFSLDQLVVCLCDMATEKFTMNRVFIPTLHALSIVTEIGREHPQAFNDEITERVLGISTRAITSIKSSPRLNASLRLIINLLQLSPSSCSKAAPKIKIFLSHPLPWFRQQTAESLHDNLIGAESEEFDNLQALLLETQWNEQASSAIASRVTTLITQIASVKLELIN